MRISIIGTAQSGKSTLFKAIVGEHCNTDNFGPGANYALVPVPDERIEYFYKIFNPKKKVPVSIEFADVAGVISGDGEQQDHSELSASGKLMSAIRDSDAIVIVLRHFASPVHPPYPDPYSTFENILTELTLADLDVCTKRIEKLEKNVSRNAASDLDKRQLAVLLQCRTLLENETGLQKLDLTPDDKKLLNSFSFFNLKPVMVVINVGEEEKPSDELLAKLKNRSKAVLTICAQIEAEIIDIPPEERASFMEEMGISQPASKQLISACYNALSLRTFFACCEREVHAWTIQAGDSAWTAAGKIHTDIQRGFIRAEIIGYDDFVKNNGDMKAIKANSQVRLESKDYEIQDGDIMHVRFNI